MKGKPNRFELATKEKMCKEVRAQYQRWQFSLIVIGTALLGIGAVAFTIERAVLETTNQNTLSWLAFIYNTLPMIGAAILSASTFHYSSKRNEEICRIAEIDEELEQIRIQRLDALAEYEEVSNESISHTDNMANLEPQHAKQALAGDDSDSFVRGSIVRTAGYDDRDRSDSRGN